MNDPRTIKVIDFNEEKGNLRVSELRIITGGKEPPSTTGNWLKDLELGSVFFVQDKTNPGDFSLGLFWLVSKNGPNHRVVILRSPKVQEDIPVDPIRFCNRYSLFFVEGLIKIPDEKEEKEEDLLKGLEND